MVRRRTVPTLPVPTWASEEGKTSKSAEIHREGFPYCHPFVTEMPPSRAAEFVAKTFPKQERHQRTIVDAGCGEGQDTLFLLGEGFHVTAIDASERNLDILCQKVSEAQIPDDILTYYIADLVERIPMDNATVDVVLDVWVLGSVILPHDGRTGAKKCLAEIHRILKPGGLFVSQFETIKPRRSPDKLREYLANLMRGHFSIMSSEPIDVDYVLYVDVPHKAKLNPALFMVARKQGKARACPERSRRDGSDLGVTHCVKIASETIDGLARVFSHNFQIQG